MNKFIRRDPFFYGSYLVLLLIACWLLLEYSKVDSLLWVNGYNNKSLDLFFKYYTNLADGLVAVMLCIVLFPINKWYGWMAALSFGLTSLISVFLKQVVFSDMPRPLAVIQQPGLLHLVDGVDVHLTNSFPSGHTLTAFSIAVLLTYIVNNRVLSKILLLYALAIGYSRMYLAQHFLIDVLAGSLIGVIFTWVSIIIVEKIRAKKKG